MTPQEIQERNKQIALMLGWERHNHASYFTWTKQNSKDHIYESILQFHLDWNWLHEAVEFIERLSVHHMVETNRSSCVIYNGKNIITANYFKADKTKKEAVFIAVSDFAKLYNEKKL